MRRRGGGRGREAEGWGQAGRLGSLPGARGSFGASLRSAFSLQNDIFEWSRDHRVHHKYSETDADPHNARRGFFFSHIGWLFVRKHRDVIEKGRKLDVTDLLADPVVRFQRK